MPPRETMQGGRRRLWLAPAVPPREAAHGSGPEPSQALRSVAQGVSRHGGRGAIVDRLMRAPLLLQTLTHS